MSAKLNIPIDDDHDNNDNHNDTDVAESGNDSQSANIISSGSTSSSFPQISKATPPDEVDHLLNSLATEPGHGSVVPLKTTNNYNHVHETTSSQVKNVQSAPSAPSMDDKQKEKSKILHEIKLLFLKKQALEKEIIQEHEKKQQFFREESKVVHELLKNKSELLKEIDEQDKLKNEYSRENNKLFSDLSALKEELKDVADQQHRLIEEKENIKNEKEYLLHELKSMQEQYEKLVVEINQLELKKNHEQLEQQKNIEFIKNTKQDLESYHDKIKNIEILYSQLNNRNIELEQIVKEKEEKIHSLDLRIKNSTEDLSKLSVSIDQCIVKRQSAIDDLAQINLQIAQQKELLQQVGESSILLKQACQALADQQVAAQKTFEIEAKKYKEEINHFSQDFLRLKREREVCIQNIQFEEEKLAELRLEATNLNKEIFDRMEKVKEGEEELALHINKKNEVALGLRSELEKTERLKMEMKQLEENKKIIMRDIQYQYDKLKELHRSVEQQEAVNLHFMEQEKNSKMKIIDLKSEWQQIQNKQREELAQKQAEAHKSFDMMLAKKKLLQQEEMYLWSKKFKEDMYQDVVEDLEFIVKKFVDFVMMHPKVSVLVNEQEQCGLLSKDLKQEFMRHLLSRFGEKGPKRRDQFLIDWVRSRPLTLITLSISFGILSFAIHFVMYFMKK